MAIADLLKRVAIDRVSGKRAPRFRALLVAAVVGAGAASVTYRVLRR